MADKAPKSSPRRRLRTPAETVRERTEKSRLAADKSPSAVRSFFSGFSWPLRKVGAGFRRLNLGRFRVFRWLGAVLAPRYFRNSWRELRLVTWPNRRVSLQLTWAVIVFAFIFGVLIAGVDYGLDKVFKVLILKK